MNGETGGVRRKPRKLCRTSRACVLRGCLFLMLLWSAVAGAVPSGLQAVRLGPGGADADPATLPTTTDAELHGAISDSGGGIWWRVEIPPQAATSQHPRVLHFSQAFGAQLIVHLGEQDGAQARQRLLQPGPTWGAWRDLPVLLPTRFEQGGYVHVRISSARARPVVPQLDSLEDYLTRTAHHRAVVWASTSALLTMTLLALAFRRGFGGGAYGSLALMALMCAGYVLGMSGEGYFLPGGQTLATFGVLLERTFAMLAIAFSLLFIDTFLQLSARRPNAARLLRALAGAQVAIVVASCIEGAQPSAWGATASNLLLLVSVPLVLLESWIAMRQGVTAGRFVLLAWSPGLAVLMAWTLSLQGWAFVGIDLAAWVYPGLALQLVVLCFGLASEGRRLRRERDSATAEAGHDPLTGALNRRALDASLKALLDDARSTQGTLSVVFMDIDHFKRINDVHGHAIGDHCLRQLVTDGHVLLQPNQLLARYGGEEFVLVLPGQDATAAARTAEQLRRRIAGRPVERDGVRVSMTVSFGVAELNAAGESVEQLLRRADAALYRAKAEGRNRVEVSEGVESTVREPKAT
jgi:diguanylate cyclase (GGDEF)-like protein